MNKSLKYLIELLSGLIIGGYLIAVGIAGNGLKLIDLISEHVVEFIKFSVALLLLFSVNLFLPKKIGESYTAILVILILLSNLGKRIQETIFKIVE